MLTSFVPLVICVLPGNVSSHRAEHRVTTPPLDVAILFFLPGQNFLEAKKAQNE